MVSTGVTGTSRKRQDFLIIGKERNRILGLVVFPSIVSANYNEELTVLAQAWNPPLVIPARTPIARAIALPANIIEHLTECQQVSFGSSGVTPDVFWVQHIGRDRPQLTCSLTCNNKTVQITGLVDTGADVTVISHMFWPKEWTLVTPLDSLSGIGGATVCLQSSCMIAVKGPEGKTATIRPFVVQKPITVWGRDLLSQWGVKLDFWWGP